MEDLEATSSPVRSIASFLLALATGLTLFNVACHAVSFSRPAEQRWIIAVLLLVPVQGVAAYSLLAFGTQTATSSVFIAARDFYEAFTIYSFIQYLLAALGGPSHAAFLLELLHKTRVEKHRAARLARQHKQRRGKVPPPAALLEAPLLLPVLEDSDGVVTIEALHALRSASPCHGDHEDDADSLSTADPRTPRGGHAAFVPVVAQRLLWPSYLPPGEARAFVALVQALLDQFIIVKALGACVILLLKLTGYYREGRVHISDAWPYVVVVINVSQVLAITALISFYKATHEALAPLHPLGKFICIKAVVFLSFWQELLFSLLAYFGLLAYLDRELRLHPFPVGPLQLRTDAQSLAILCEMVVAASAHLIFFSVASYWHDSYGLFPPDAGHAVQLQFDDTHHHESAMTDVEAPAAAAVSHPVSLARADSLGVTTLTLMREDSALDVGWFTPPSSAPESAVFLSATASLGSGSSGGGLSSSRVDGARSGGTQLRDANPPNS